MADDHTKPASRQLARRIGGIVLVALGVVLLALGAYSTWLRTQVLDTDAWVETSRETLERPEVRSAVAVWTVDEVFDRTDPEKALADVLPPRAQPLAGPLTSRLRVESYDVAEKALDTAVVERAWVTANRRAHERFMRVVDGRSPIIVQGRSGLQIDVRPLLERISDRLGAGEQVIERIPESVTTVEPKDAEQVERGIKVLRVLEEWGNRITFIGLVFVLLGIWASPARRRAWMWAGGTLAVASWLIGQSRELVRPLITEAVSDSSTWRAAVAATWDTVSEPLVDAATAGIVIGIGTVVLAWIAGPSELMVSARRFAAPVLVDRRPLAIAIAAIAGILLVNWIGAIDSRRTSIQALAVLGVIGAVWAMSRTAERELAATTEPATSDAARDETTESVA